MPRKDNRNNPLQIRIQAVSVPKSIRPEMYLTRLMQVITEERPLPPGWDVRLHWRNPGVKYGLTKRWRYDSFEDSIRESRTGFGNIVLWTLQEQLRRVQIRRQIDKQQRRRKRGKT